MDEFGESYESDSSFDSGMDLGGSESFESFDSPDMSFTESEPLSEGFDEAPLEDYSSGGEDLSFDETPALEDNSSDMAELPFDDTPALEDSSEMEELPFDETPSLEEPSDTEELPFDEMSPLENPDVVPNDISEELDTLDAIEDDPSAMLDKAPEEDLSYFEDQHLEDTPESEVTEPSEELPPDETVPETEDVPETTDDFEELPFDEAEAAPEMPEASEVTDVTEETEVPEAVEPTEDSSLETDDYETAPETLDNVDPESSGELAPSENPYSDAWEQFSEEVNEGDEQSSDWDSLKEVPFSGEDAPESVEETAEAPEEVPEQAEETAEVPEEVPETAEEPAEVPEEVAEDKPYESVADYMNAHNYGQKDFETYSQDPEWRELMRKEYPDYELPELSPESAKEQLNKYMSDHNYGIEDYDEYSQDPTWRELHSTVFPDDELPPLNEEVAEMNETPEVGEWIGEINPNFDPFDMDSPYCNNCGSCAYAVYQRLEGNPDICASAENIGLTNEMEDLTGMEQVSMSPEDIESKLLDAGNGAHAIIGIDRAEGPGHWFNAANMDGKVVAIDGQSGEIMDWPPDYGDVVNWDMSIKKEDM